MIQVPTMREVFQGVGPARVDGDAPGDQFRTYEFAGMAHIDSRDAVAYYPDPCKLPISRYPMAAYMSVALNHMWQWIDKGTVPPHEVPLYLSAADCVAFASFREGAPNMVKEALACNVPVVSVDVGDVAERLAGVYPSRIVERDPVEFGNALADIVAAGLRSNGREVVTTCSEKSVVIGGVCPIIVGHDTARDIETSKQATNHIVKQWCSS